MTGLMLLFLGIPSLKAQDAYIAENKTLDMMLAPATPAPTPFDAPKHAFAIQMPFNGNKFGLGLRYSYDFTKICRFSLDCSYYFYTAPERKFKTITRSGVKGEKPWGRTFDFNPNVNFVFGNGNFHFYMITGFYISFGYSELDAAVHEVSEIFGEGFIWQDPDTGEEYYYEDRLDDLSDAGFGVNLGFGIEVQATERIRWFLEQHLALGLMTSFMPMMGLSICF